MQGLTHQSCVQELKSKVEELTGIPCDVQKIMVGYPPSSLDLQNGDAHLKDYPIKSGRLSNIIYIINVFLSHTTSYHSFSRNDHDNYRFCKEKFYFF